MSVFFSLLFFFVHLFIFFVYFKSDAAIRVLPLPRSCVGLKRSPGGCGGESSRHAGKGETGADVTVTASSVAWANSCAHTRVRSIDPPPAAAVCVLPGYDV